jgi:bifunctional non-homologous end joining protein LigD
MQGARRRSTLSKAATPRPSEVPGARPAALPTFVAPQLATLVERAPADDEWIHEMKFDGYRILARLDQGRVRLLSRNGRDWTGHFARVAEAAASLPARQAMLDGEVAVLLPDGTTSFQALQNALSGGAEGELVYMLFDLVHLDGSDLTGARLEDRKMALARLLGQADPGQRLLRFSDHVIGSGPEFFAQACRLGLEGIIAKRRGSPYRSGRRQDWLKVKCMKRQEVVIGGYTDPEGSRIGIGALLAGVHEDGRLVYAGKVGTGFSERVLRDLTKRLRGLAQAACPFEPCPTGVGRAHWVKPELVAEVTFSEWTADGRMRHPSFQGLREDKPADQVVRERPASIAGGADGPRPSRPRAVAAARGGSEAEVAGVRLTHATRVLYPRLGTTKLDLARFYEAIAEWILPHLVDRPTTLVRCPEGVQNPCFYQKHTGYWAPPEIRRVKIKEKTKTGEYLVVDTLPALVGLAQIGILEVHTWNSVVKQLEKPNRLVFDLDPAPDVEWKRVVEAARLVRARLDALGLESFVKTTGGKGLHVVVPVARGTTWEAGAAFSRALAEDMAREDPTGYVAHMAKSARTGKIFIDYLRNVRGATSVSAYSTRAKPEATVSVPLGWDELSPRVRSDHFTIATVSRRLAGLGKDPWARYWSVRQALPRPRAAR